MPYTLYILRCIDDTYYTGIALDLESRLATHRAGKGSKYVRTRLPFEVAYTEFHPDKSSAMKREAQIKRWSREKKITELKLTAGV